jgi:hypothetical protein
LQRATASNNKKTSFHRKLIAQVSVSPSKLLEKTSKKTPPKGMQNQVEQTYKPTDAAVELENAQWPSRRHRHPHRPQIATSNTASPEPGTEETNKLGSFFRTSSDRFSPCHPPARMSADVAVHIADPTSPPWSICQVPMHANWKDGKQHPF